MAVAGPRLDRPSAIGDEGRPRAASLTVAALAVLVLLTVTAHHAGTLRIVPIIGLAVGLTVAGIALLERHRYPHLVAGHMCFHIAGTTLLLLLAVFALAPNGLVLAGYTIALLGIALTWADVGRTPALENALVQAAGSYVGIVGSFVVFVLIGGIAIWCWRLLLVLFAETAPGPSLTAFLAVLGLAGLVVHAASRGVPVVELTRRDRQQAVAATLRRGRWWLARGSLLALGVAGLLLFVSSGDGGGTVDPAASPGASLAVLSSPVVLGPIVLVATIVLIAGVLGRTTDWLTGRWDEGLWRRLAAATAGTLLGVVVLVSAVAPTGGVRVGGVSIVTLAIAGPIEVIIAIGIVWFLLEAGLLPERALGPALATGGLVLATATLGLGTFPAPLVFATAAGALLVWDVATFGMDLTVELGHRPDTRRLELFHAGLSLAVALGAVFVLVGLEVLRQSVGTTIGAAPAMAIAGLGLAVLVLPLRA